MNRIKKAARTTLHIEAGKMKIEWGSQIRNYVMQPYKLVKDVRILTRNQQCGWRNERRHRRVLEKAFSMMMDNEKKNRFQIAVFT